MRVGGGVEWFKLLPSRRITPFPYGMKRTERRFERGEQNDSVKIRSCKENERYRKRWSQFLVSEMTWYFLKWRQVVGRKNYTKIICMNVCNSYHALPLILFTVYYFCLVCYQTTRSPASKAHFCVSTVRLYLQWRFFSFRCLLNLIKLTAWAQEDR